ncbi:MAG: hypothetical protein AUF67_00990 [Acidobacteria bacterium 13_1_20CM_58_21]|nr:MAG: hypothetical protein AUF67_00990 [Acidobacteria bacterium 13_1_20CM_58_21]
MGGRGFSSGGALGKNPFKGIVEIAEDANPCFTQGVTKYLEHSSQAKHNVTAHKDGTARTR